VGTVAVGRIACGQLKQGQAVVIMPRGIQGEATSIEIFHNDRKEVIAGDLIGFRVKNASVSDIERGMVACDPDNVPCKPAVKFTAQVIVLNHPGQIRVGYAPFFFCHTASFPAKFSKLLQKVDKKTGQVLEENPKFIKSGDAAIVELEPFQPQCLEVFKDFPPLGRLLIRDIGLTVAVGVVKSVEYSQAKNAPKPLKGKSKYFR